MTMYPFNSASTMELEALLQLSPADYDPQYDAEASLEEPLPHPYDFDASELFAYTPVTNPPSEILGVIDPYLATSSSDFLDSQEDFQSFCESSLAPADYDPQHDAEAPLEEPIPHPHGFEASGQSGQSGLSSFTTPSSETPSATDPYLATSSSNFLDSQEDFLSFCQSSLAPLTTPPSSGTSAIIERNQPISSSTPLRSQAVNTSLLSHSAEQALLGLSGPESLFSNTPTIHPPNVDIPDPTYQQAPHPPNTPPNPAPQPPISPASPPPTLGTPTASHPLPCPHPHCTSKILFTRSCDLRKHYSRHSKHLFCRHAGCASTLGFSTEKDRARHEAGHQPGVGCEWEGCAQVFSRRDNMRDHVRRVHEGKGRGRRGTTKGGA